MTTARLKHFLDVNDGGCWGDDPTGFEDTVVLRSTEQTAAGEWKISDPALRSISAQDKARRVVKFDDIIITKSSGSSMHIGKASIADQDVASLRAVYSNFMQRIQVSNRASPRYICYLLNSTFARRHYNLHTKSSSGLGNLSKAIIGDISVPVIDKRSQEDIADFLDRETKAIDKVIQKKSGLHALLCKSQDAEIRRVFSQAQAGNRMRLRHIAVVRKGRTTAGDALDHGLKPLLTLDFLRTGDASAFVDDDRPVVAASEHDTLIVWDGSNAGEIMRSRSGVVSATLAKVQVHYPHCPAFLYYALKEHESLLRESCQGMGIPHVDGEQLKGLRLFWPDRHEQALIAAELDRKCSQIDSAIEKIDASLKLLAEYRVSLITAAVTGKVNAATWNGDQTIADCDSIAAEDAA